MNRLLAEDLRQVVLEERGDLLDDESAHEQADDERQEP